MATYRVQLHGGFDFDAAAQILDYLTDLGVSDLYCSPILHATRGSLHGYDVVDHAAINPELGGEDALARLVEHLGRRDMGLTVDVVPNHMAIDGRANRWWWDVLENGQSSRYAGYFDIDWLGEAERSGHTVLMPILGDRYGRVIESGDLVVERDGGAFILRYYDHELPVSPRTYDTLLVHASARGADPALPGLADEFGALPPAELRDIQAREVRHERKEILKERLNLLCQSDPATAEAIELELKRLRADPDELDALLRRQNYRLAFWQVAREDLDYRRFFNIETLVGLRTDQEDVFASVHAKTLGLVQKGWVDGVRVDHIDGLRDPEGYLQRIRAVTPEVYVVVEKILAGSEEWPSTWPAAGTTGYDFMARVNNVMVDPAGEPDLTGCYSRLTGEPTDYRQVEREAKRQIMREDLAPEVERLTRMLLSICDANRTQRDRTRSELRVALTELVAAFPVYRTYIHPGRALDQADERHIWAAVAAAERAAPAVDQDLFEFIGELLLLRWPGAAETEFALTFPQVTAPVMAKGAEDTAFYRYHRLVSLNEVGGDPATVGRPLADFYEWCRLVEGRHPETMLALDTHDTKRGSDVRARIHLLSEMPAAWEATATSWLDRTDSYSSREGPDLNIRYLFLQTLVGAWPIETERMIAYMGKAAREAKVHTSWTEPNEGYDEALRRFVEASLSDRSFRQSVDAFLADHDLVELGRSASLVQTALLLTCPGVPDLYQGSEVWTNRLVDPDNRVGIDYSKLRGSDQAKPRLIRNVLHHRRQHPDDYAGFDPLQAAGTGSDRVVAFARSGLVTVASRHLASPGGWDDTTIDLPRGGWIDLVSGRTTAGGRARLAELLESGPAAVLVRG